MDDADPYGVAALFLGQSVAHRYGRSVEVDRFLADLLDLEIPLLPGDDVEHVVGPIDQLVDRFEADPLLVELGWALLRLGVDTPPRTAGCRTPLSGGVVGDAPPRSAGGGARGRRGAPSSDAGCPVPAGRLASERVLLGDGGARLPGRRGVASRARGTPRRGARSRLPRPRTDTGLVPRPPSRSATPTVALIGRPMSLAAGPAASVRRPGSGRQRTDRIGIGRIVERDHELGDTGIGQGADLPRHGRHVAAQCPPGQLVDRLAWSVDRDSFEQPAMAGRGRCDEPVDLEGDLQAAAVTIRASMARDRSGELGGRAVRQLPPVGPPVSGCDRASPGRGDRDRHRWMGESEPAGCALG